LGVMEPNVIAPNLLPLYNPPSSISSKLDFVVGVFHVQLHVQNFIALSGRVADCRMPSGTSPIFEGSELLAERSAHEAHRWLSGNKALDGSSQHVYTH